MAVKKKVGKKTNRCGLGDKRDEPEFAPPVGADQGEDFVHPRQQQGPEVARRMWGRVRRGRCWGGREWFGLCRGLDRYRIKITLSPIEIAASLLLMTVALLPVQILGVRKVSFQ